ncbi:hypothetical protein BBF96_10120 [Anoxybacter fermentans]|uniref:Radical SAM core domain-containing protein n=1 Tax=Anoxybacter fermentans TaxID=1323375 RepID=A0A3S9SZK7_9FIRM|nr:radical SAM protein [Anoxybacter fermentans]AZR73707.1 hypothetical protein BBF96_10120 [Anoxybacter fermentans]
MCDGLKYLRGYINEFFRLRALAISKKLIVQFHLTSKCSMKCKHCYIYMNSERYQDELANELSFSWVCRVIDSIYNTAIKLQLDPVIEFTGGDPFLRDDFTQIIDYVKNKGIKFGIKGNPVFLTDELIKNLKENGLIRYQLSLDGIESTHDFIRSKGSFQKTIKGIQLLNQNDIPVFIKYTVSKLNQNDLKPLIYFLDENNLKISAFSVARYADKDNIDEMIYKPDEMKELFELLLDVYIKIFSNKTKNIHFLFKEHLWYPFLHQKGYIDNRLLQKMVSIENCYNCTMTKNIFVITPTGDIYKCRKVDASFLGNVKESSFQDLVYGVKHKQLLDTLQNSECRHCFYYNVCLGCPAITEAVRKNIVERDPGCFLYKSNI